MHVVISSVVRGLSVCALAHALLHAYPCVRACAVLRLCVARVHLRVCSLFLEA